MEIPLVDEDKFSVVVEFDAVDKHQDSTSGTLVYEVEAKDAGEATIQAVQQANRHLQETWRNSAQLFNVRVSTVYLTEEVRRAIEKNQQQEQEATE